MTTSVGDEVFCPLFSQRSNARKCLRILNGLLNNGQFVDPPTQYVDLFEPLVTLFLLQRPSRGRGKSNDDAGKSDDDARISSPSPSHPRSRKNISLPNGNGLPVSVPVTPKEIYEAGEALLSDPDAVLAFEQSMAGIFVAVFPSMFHPFLSTKLRKKPETPASSTSLKLKKEVSPKPKADRKRSRSTSLPPSVSSEAIESVNASKPSECSSLLDSLRISIEEAGDSFCEPFAKDSEFIKAIEAFYYLRDRYLGVLALSDILKYLVRKAGIEPFEMFTLHRNILSLLQHHTHIRTLSMEREPKVLQLSKKLNLSSKETKALVYLVMAQGGSVCCVDLPQAFHPASIAYRCGMDVEELHHFLQEDREHIHQGLLVVSESTFLPSSKVLLPQEAAVALSGVSVSHEQMAKLENTVLGELIVSEWQKRDEDSNADAEAEEPHSESADEEPGEEETNESLIVGDSTSCEAVEDAKKNIPIVSPSGSAGGVAAELAVTKSNEPYRSNCECMEAAFYLISLMIKIRTMEGDIKEEQELEKRKKEEAAVRGLEGKLRIAQKVHTSRVKVTIEAGAFIPAIEVLSKKFGLTEMEKNILLLLVGNAISHDVVVAINGRYFMREGQRYMTVGYVLFVLCKGLTQRVEARQAFYHSSRLVSNSLISLSVEMGVSRSCFNTDLMEYTCDIDRKIVDLLMGREMESREMVPGSSVISPTVSLDKVVLPRAVMEKVLSRVEHFSLVNECKKKFAFGENLGESMNGLVLLFYGPSGTGKTMLAHAVAKEIGKKLLLVDTANFKRAANGPEILRYLFREAKLRDAIIFFDECESIFASREDNALVTTLLAEFEKYDGMILLATNVAECFDESMNRRISLMIEFKPPDHSMRHQIWASHIPPKLSLAPDVSLEQLALDYELTGGLIRNAVLAAINNAVSRENTSSPTL